jgi:flagellar FliL protein
MNKLKLTLLLLVGGVLVAAAGAAGAWWMLKPGKAPDAKAVKIDTHEYKYVTLDKVIVMLRTQSGEPMSHYLAVDLVFKTPEKSEKITKEHLPLLRSVAVNALSEYTLERAGQMSVQDFTKEINRAFSKSYEHSEKPFSEALIGKLIIE